MKIPTEIRNLIESGCHAHLVTLNPDGSPQVTLVWIGLDGDEIVAAHLPRNQKVRNIERDPRGSILIEDGVDYDKLRGVFVRGRFEIIDDQELCYRIALASAQKYQGLSEEQAGTALRYYIRKRVAVVFHPGKVSSWDHRKTAEASAT